MSDAAMTRQAQTPEAENTGAEVLARVILSPTAVEKWPALLVAAGWRTLAPCLTKDGSIEYALLPNGGNGSTEACRSTALGNGLPAQSPKAAYFPRTEPILRLDRKHREWEISDPGQLGGFPLTVVFGARPCDAAAPGVLSPLFGWDYHDPFFEARLKNLAFVVAGCTGPVDNACFCSSTGVDPAGQGLGDVLLTSLAHGAWLAEAHTGKGAQLLNLLPPNERQATDDVPAAALSVRDGARKAVPPRFDERMVRQALEKRFDDPLWERSARSCLGCGVCAFTCPTCHCFDIQDELCGCRGVRQKNWDACAFPLFTLHTSGHNPRPDQASRWRQRLSHKFWYYPEKFGRPLCTGCGRCLRICPAGMDMLADLEELAQSATADTAQAAAAEPRPTAVTSGHPEVRLTPDGGNIYRPYKMRIAALRDETSDVRTLRLEFTDPKDAETFSFRVGQFGLYSAFGEGESTFCIASSPTRKGYIECTFRLAGRVTKALRRLDVGDFMGFRGPYGNTFPVEDWKGKSLLFIAGGIALPPVRCVIQYCLDNRQDYRDMTIVYGARTWNDHVYKHELAEWEKRSDAQLWMCIDWKPAPDGKGLSEQAALEGWTPIHPKDPGATQLSPAHRRYTAFVPQMVEAVRPSPDQCVAVLCGPPIMIKFTLQSLRKLGFDPSNVYTTLENRMKCGVGKCGRCNVGPVYVCKEGPVFTAEQLLKLPPEM
jgi:NAD(P)H-flavin reductase/formate hydrogenlyase subunit 6/NADH:ubiquinone oxidoreductase subunit I